MPAKKNHVPSAKPPLVKTSLSEQAFGMLEEMIVTLQLPPGSPVTEAKLVERRGIGRTPLREALQRRAREHRVGARPQPRAVRRARFVWLKAESCELKASCRREALKSNLV